MEGEISAEQKPHQEKQIDRCRRRGKICHRKRRITVCNLLQMQSGLDCFEMPGTGPYRESESDKSPDKLAADFGLPMGDEPGTVWRYCSGSTFLLGVAKAATQRDATSEVVKAALSGARKQCVAHTLDHVQIC